MRKFKYLGPVEDNLPQKLDSTWHSIPPEFDLNPPQAEARKHLFKPNNVLVSAKPNTGKTAIAEMYGSRTLRESAKGVVVYVGIMRSLAAEKHEEWTAKKHPWSKYPQMLVSGDHVMTESRINQLSEARVICITPEAFLSRIRKPKSKASKFLKNAQLVIADEIHLVADEGRGPNYEAVMAELSAVCPHARYLLLSGTLPNVEEFGSWLRLISGRPTSVVTSDWTPLKIDQHWYTMRGYKFNDQKREIVDITTGIIAAHPGESFLIAVYSKSFGRELQTHLQRVLGERVEFHNADLDTAARKDIEHHYRQRLFRVLLATSTLFTGVNIPAEHVIITRCEQPFIGDIPTYELLQAAGRAGRVGLVSRGVQHFICPLAKLGHHRTRVQNPPPVRSNFLREEHLPVHLLAGVVGDYVQTVSDIPAWHEQSLSAVQLSGAGRSTKALELPVHKAMADLQKWRAVDNLEFPPTAPEYPGQSILPTALGAVAVEMLLHPSALFSAMMRLIELEEMPHQDEYGVAAVWGTLLHCRAPLSRNDTQNMDMWRKHPMPPYVGDVSPSYYKACEGLVRTMVCDPRDFLPFEVHSPTRAALDELPRLTAGLARLKETKSGLKGVSWETLYTAALWPLCRDLDKTVALVEALRPEQLGDIIRHRRWNRGLSTLLQYAD